MITIEEVKKIIHDFKLNINEAKTDFDKSDDLSFRKSILKARQFATALDLYKYMVSNDIDKIEKPYYVCFTDAERNSIVHNLASRVSKIDSTTTIYDAPRNAIFIVLDRNSPLFMTKVTITSRLCLSNIELELTFSDMYNPMLIFFNLYSNMNENGGKFPTFDSAVRVFIKSTITDRYGIFHDKTEEKKE